MRQYALWALVVIWAAAFLTSLYQFSLPPGGDGFTRGLNRVSGFMQWQMVAMVVALVLLALRRQAESRVLARTMVIPAYFAIALVLLVAGVLGYAWIMHP